jgi:hypothetical protein
MSPTWLATYSVAVPRRGASATGFFNPVAICVRRICAAAKFGATGLRVVEVGVEVEVVGESVVAGRVPVEPVDFFELPHAPSRHATTMTTTNR